MMRPQPLFLLGILLPCLGLNASPDHDAGRYDLDDAPTDAPTLEVGDKSVRGKRIGAFDSEWTAGGGAIVSEVAKFERRDGKKRLVRVQTWPMGSGVDLRSELVLDAATLSTVSFQQEVVGMPEGGSMGGAPSFLRWDYDGGKYTRKVRRDGGAEEVEEGALPQPMFEGSALGLVIAALPLELDYEARLPVAMNLGLTEELTLYWVEVRVTAQEPFEWKRKEVAAWVVEVDWEDFATGEVTSKGGVDAPGGAYFVVTDPPKGFPHVPRYQNESGTIELVVEE